MPQNSLLIDSENRSDLATAKSFAEFLDSAGIGTSVGITTTDNRFTVPDSRVLRDNPPASVEAVQTAVVFRTPELLD